MQSRRYKKFIGVPKGSNRAVDGKVVFEEIMVENITELMKDASDKRAW